MGDITRTTEELLKDAVAASDVYREAEVVAEAVAANSNYFDDPDAAADAAVEAAICALTVAVAASNVYGDSLEATPPKKED